MGKIFVVECGETAIECEVPDENYEETLDFIRKNGRYLLVPLICSGLHYRWDGFIERISHYGWLDPIEDEHEHGKLMRFLSSIQLRREFSSPQIGPKFRIELRTEVTESTGNEGTAEDELEQETNYGSTEGEDVTTASGQDTDSESRNFSEEDSDSQDEDLSTDDIKNSYAQDEYEGSDDSPKRIQKHED
ncbi:MAG: hypothetical protein M1816_004996 [Peltula sp. TS41687]|nr:MAG: hypothetical protein M1816_004996 [Peltula sp. TS41687]